jgi:hypothetical protein
VAIPAPKPAGEMIEPAGRRLHMAQRGAMERQPGHARVSLCDGAGLRPDPAGNTGQDSGPLGSTCMAPGSAIMRTGSCIDSHGRVRAFGQIADYGIVHRADQRQHVATGAAGPLCPIDELANRLMHGTS